MKNLNLIISLGTLFLVFTACTKNDKIIYEEQTDEAFAKIEPLLGEVLESREATEEEIYAIKKNNQLAAYVGCSLDSDAGCSSESTAEFLHYVNNCVSYTPPSFGGFFYKTTLAAISYYVDGDTDVNCDQYEDDLQQMIDDVAVNYGPIWSLSASVYSVSPCSERSFNNYIVFELEMFTSTP